MCLELLHFSRTSPGEGVCSDAPAVRSHGRRKQVSQVNGALINLDELLFLHKALSLGWLQPYMFVTDTNNRKRKERKAWRKLEAILFWIACVNVHSPYSLFSCRTCVCRWQHELLPARSQAGGVCSHTSYQLQSSLSTSLCPRGMHSILATAEAETSLELPCTWAAQGGCREVGICPSWPVEIFPAWCMFVMEVVGQDTFPAQGLPWLLLLEQDDDDDDH